MVAHEDREKLRPLGLAGVRGNLMHAVGRFVETLAALVNSLGLASHLSSNGAVEHISDHRAGMAVRRRRSARGIRYLDDMHRELAAIQSGKTVRESLARRRRASRLLAPRMLAHQAAQNNIAPSAGPFANLKGVCMVFLPAGVRNDEVSRTTERRAGRACATREPCRGTGRCWGWMSVPVSACDGRRRRNERPAVSFLA